MEQKRIIKIIEPTPTELISWHEIFAITGYLFICIITVFEILTPWNLLVFIPFISIIVPPQHHNRFPLFSNIGKTISKFQISSTFLLTIIAAISVLIFQLLMVVLFFYLF